MATKRFTELTEITSAADEDIIPIHDVSAGADRKISKANLIGGGLNTAYFANAFGEIIYSTWEFGTTNFIDHVNVTSFTPELADFAIRARLNNAETGGELDSEFQLRASVPRWRQLADVNDNGGFFETVVGWYKPAGGSWTALTGRFTESTSSGSSPSAYDFRSDLITLGGGGQARFYVKFHTGATKGVEFWMQDNSGNLLEFDETPIGGEGMIQLFVRS